MKRTLALIYGFGAYAVFLSSFLYAIAWLANLWVPKTIDSGAPGPLVEAIVINLLLLSAFAIQHSVMARPAFKRWFTQFVSPAVERSTYVLAASLLLFAICLYWRPMPNPVWQVGGAGGTVLAALGWLGWLTVLLSTFMINHFDLFGLRQVWQYSQGVPQNPPLFVERMFYKLVRHPIMLGFLLAFWATPVMSTGHLLFTLVTTAYILVGVQLEERDLKAAHGASYEDYRKRVPMLLPIPRSRL